MGDEAISVTQCFSTPHLSLRGGALFAPTWQSLIPNAYWEHEKRDCFGAERQAPRNDNDREYESRPSEIATAHKASLAMTDRESLGIDSRKLPRATCVALAMTKKERVQACNDASREHENRFCKIALGYFRSPRNDERKGHYEEREVEGPRKLKRETFYNGNRKSGGLQ